jgi:hypothetical protein
MPSSDLPLPEGWQPVQQNRWAAVTAVSLVLGVLMVIGGLSGLDGEYWQLAVAFVALGAMLLLGVATRKRRRTDAPVTTDGGALRIGLSRAGLLLELAGLVLGGVATAFLALGAARAEAWVFVVISGATALGVAGYLVVRLARGISVGELELAPEGVRLRVDGRDDRLAWEDVLSLHCVDVRDRNGTVTRRRLTLRGDPTGGTARGIAQRASAGVELPLHRIDLDDVLVYHLLHHYHRHPEDRGELAGPAAMTRLRERAFPG